MLGSLKLIISFGKEKMKLKEYEDLAMKAYLAAKKAQIFIGLASGSFMLVMIGFSCYSWFIGFWMIKYEV